MSYTKTVWRDGDVITAAKMNKIENGIEDATSSGGSGGGLRELVIDENGIVHGATWDEITAEFLEPTTDIFGLFTVKKIDLDNNVPYAYQLGSVWQLTSCMYNGGDASTGAYKVCAASIAMDYGYTQDGEGVYYQAESAGIDFMLYENQLYAEYSLSGIPL